MLFGLCIFTAKKAFFVYSFWGLLCVLYFFYSCAMFLRKRSFKRDPFRKSRSSKLNSPPPAKEKLFILHEIPVRQTGQRLGACFPSTIPGSPARSRLHKSRRHLNMLNSTQEFSVCKQKGLLSNFKKAAFYTPSQYNANLCGTDRERRFEFR